MNESKISKDADSFDSTAAVAAGFEVAVADYESSWLVYHSSEAALRDAHHAVQLASGRLEEASISLDEIATEFNAANVTDNDYDELMSLLDTARDHMIKASDDYDAANNQLLHANEQYESNRASIDETLAIARELRTELDHIVHIGGNLSAANDDYYQPTETLNGLSEPAKHFYRNAA